MAERVPEDQDPRQREDFGDRGGTMRWRLALGSALLAVVASLLAPSPSSHAAAGTMGKQRAADYYMDSVCPANRAANRFSWRVWLGRDSITYREIRRRLPEIRRETRLYRDALRKSAAALKNPPKSWPEPPDTLVSRLAGKTTREVGALNHAAIAKTARYWARWIRVYYRAARRINEPPKIRAALGLPKKGGCARR